MAADQLGCPVGTIRSRLATTRERLRRRLTRRGLAPTVIPVGLSGPGLIPALESAALSISVPAALVDSTVRGALRVGLGKGALVGIFSVGAVTLMDGVLKTMATTRLTILTTTILLAGLVKTGVGVAAYSALGRDEGLAGETNAAQAASQKTGASAPASRKPGPRFSGLPPAVEATRRRSEENVSGPALREYEAEIAIRWNR